MSRIKFGPCLGDETWLHAVGGAGGWWLCFLVFFVLLLSVGDEREGRSDGRNL